tara:strand:- start:10754 stop:11290 length:537 start_codon:yes stop_codon:yes gene_type:complete
MRKKVKVKDIIANKENPRIISDIKFEKLVKSIKNFPEMLEKRPLIVDENMVVLGGNMRLKALQKAGLKEVTIDIANGWTEEQKKEFIIKDNVGFGEWDWDILANTWNVEEIKNWGLDVPDYHELPDFNELDENKKNKPATMKITFQNVDDLQKAEIDIKELLDRKYNGAHFSVSAGEI